MSPTEQLAMLTLVTELARELVLLVHAINASLRRTISAVEGGSGAVPEVGA